MKYFLTIVLGTLIFISCSEKPSKKSDDKSANSKVVSSSKPDIAVGKISLLSSKNIDEYLGKNSMDRLTKVEESKDIPNLSVLSSDKSQKLTVYFHPGGKAKEFSEFKVNYNTQSDKYTKPISENEFETESKIKLGISIDDLKTIKGEPKNTYVGEITTLLYKIDDYKNSKFLKKYNYPSYYAQYKFKDKKLIEFKFGFELP